ncbi:LysR family transcriptional regulator [uncultured Jatrophihabitans sp.]|uniref:LysR family transcriptional regulator n=1 Tax=uncultured Jatrophihabitans sp. TaxID=1610747 RepID=UPI0035CB6628
MATPGDSAELLDVARLRLLREIGLRGSIAGAARAVGITPSAVSQQLAALERETATSLVDRSPRGVELTGAGHALAARAEQVLDVLAAARADLDRLAGSVAGPVRLAAVASAAATFVSSAVCALRVDEPGLALSVVATEPEQGIGLLLAGDVDIAIVDEYDYVPLAVPDAATVRELAVEPLVLVLPAGARRRRPTLASLADAEWVMPPAAAACGRAVRAACRTAGFEPRVRWQTDDMLLLVRAVADGHGVAVLPRRAVAADSAPVAVRTLREPVLRRRLLAVARASAAQRPAVATVLAALGAAVSS